ncbi:MAG: complement resistance protein TraT [Mariprofundaceae bacterium]
MRVKILCSLILLVFFLAGCMPEQHRSVSVPRTPFMEPYGPEQNQVYLQALNTSQFKELDMTYALRRELNDRGYTIVSNPDDADFILQVNMRFADRETERMSGVGTVGGGIAGGVIGNNSGGGHSTGRTVAGAAIGAAVGSLAEYLAGDQLYTMWVDYRLTQIIKQERLPTHTGTVAAHAEGSRLHSMSDVFADLRDRTSNALAGFFTRLNRPETAPATLEPS